LETGQQNEAQNCSESSRPTFHTFEHNIRTFPNGTCSKDPEISVKITACKTGDSIFERIAGFETPLNQNVPVQQFELGQLDCSYEHWSSPEGMDLDLLLFNFSPQSGANADIRT
jgi:hypothetical protein